LDPDLYLGCFKTLCMKFLCFLFLIPLAGLSQDFSLFQKKQYINDHDTLPYRILYPENYDQSKKYPLILFLHGGGERGKDNEKQLVNGAKLFIDPAVRQNFPAIVIAPQCPADSYWASVKFERTKYPLDLDFNYKYEITKGLRLAIELTRQIIKEESVDQKRVYITGLSMGGMGSLEAIYRNPDLFAAGAIVCGGGDVAAYSKKQTKTAFWLFHGDADSVIPVKHSREMTAKLKELKADVKYTEYAGVNHNSWDNAYAEPTLMEWMFSKKR
jgi:predicted peptidase